VSTNAAKTGLEPEAAVEIGVLDAVEDFVSALTQPRRGRATSNE